MEKIEWLDEYNVGNISIDNEHEVFVQIIQKINQAHNEKMNQKYLGRLIDELFKYATFHFCSEENIMYFSNYPDIDFHIEEHQKLIFQLSEITPVIANHQSNIDDLIKFLMKWFVQHTVQEDKKLSKYLKKI